MLAQWAAVHSSDPTQGPDGVIARRLGDVLVQVGGDGTPGVQDFCLGEIALARGTRTGAGREPPPDQTGTNNCGPLGRRHHRWKTHAGYHSRQCGEGRYLWLAPHGLAFLIDHTGTHRIHPEKARMILGAPVGVDLYPS